MFFVIEDAKILIMFELCKENLSFSVVYYKFVRLFVEELFGNLKEMRISLSGSCHLTLPFGVK